RQLWCRFPLILEIRRHIVLPAAPLYRRYFHQTCQFPGQEITHSQTGRCAVEVVLSLAADQATLINPENGKAGAEGQLMISSNLIEVVADLIRVCCVLSENGSGAEAETTCNRDMHIAFGVSEGFDSHIGGPEKLHAGPADDGSIHRHAECID